MIRSASRWFSFASIVASFFAGPGAAAAEGSWTLELSAALPGQVETKPALSPAERTALEERLGSAESWRTAGRILTWTGVAFGGLGAGLMAIGAAGYASGIFSLNLGSMAGGAVVFITGAITAGVGVVALAVGIPLWAVNAGRISRLQKQLERSQPTLLYDPQSRTTLLGWRWRF
jgi:hypothetical protein